VEPAPEERNARVDRSTERLAPPEGLSGEGESLTKRFAGAIDLPEAKRTERFDPALMPPDRKTERLDPQKAARRVDISASVEVVVPAPATTTGDEPRGLAATPRSSRDPARASARASARTCSRASSGAAASASSTARGAAAATRSSPSRC
jgi:hypothetical protein